MRFEQSIQIKLYIFNESLILSVLSKGLLKNFNSFNLKLNFYSENNIYLYLINYLKIS